MSPAQALHDLRAVLPRGGSVPAEVWETRHRGIRTIAWLHVPVLATIMVLHSQVDVSPIALLAVAALLAAGGYGPTSQRLRSSAVTLSLLTSTALLIELFHGLIEMHFHFFVVIAIVAIYQSWTPYLLAIGFVLAHHIVMGIFMPMDVYNHMSAIDHPVRFSIIHAAFVLAESIACLSYWKITEAAADSERAERLRAEAMGENLAQANREMSDLLAMVSHDLRSPVTVINGYASMALDSWDELPDATVRDFVHKMSLAGRSLEEMLDDTLTLSADDADGLHSHPVAVRVDQAVHSALVTQPDLGTRLNLDATGPAVALVDKGQLFQILTNLVTNALKYGAAPFSISTTTHDSAVRITVTDNGPGVPPDFVPRLFDRFARADEARRGGQKGTGLGLYIVRRLAQANGGSVRYEPGPRGGASFVVELPRAPRLAMPVRVGDQDSRPAAPADRSARATGA
jgi:signal transduction histidine kinase